MPEQEKRLRSSNNGEGVLDAQAMLSHHAHIKGGLRRLARCKFCVGGVDAVIAYTKEEEPGPDVVQGDRSDEEGNASPPLVGGERGDEDRQSPW